MNQRPSDAPMTEVIEDLSKWPGHGIRFKVEEPIVDVSIQTSILIIFPCQLAHSLVFLFCKHAVHVIGKDHGSYGLRWKYNGYDKT
jgi:hypothetical protein